MAVTLLVAVALPLLLPPNFTKGPDWIVSAVEGALLVALIVADPGRIDRRSTIVRGLSIGLVVILVIGAALVTVRLVADLVSGGPETNSAAQLLRVGGLVWVYLIITFAFLYWELDSGGPEARARAVPEFPNLAFPEQLNPRISPPGWRPEFFDYLYLGLHQRHGIQPDRRDAHCPVGKVGHGRPGHELPDRPRVGHRPSSQHPQDRPGHRSVGCRRCRFAWLHPAGP